MRVFHIIPAAFNYFDDIQDAAFKLIDELNDLGIEVDATTIQYGTVKKSAERHIQKIAPSREYVGNMSVAEAIERSADYDIIHVHCPLFGVAGKILNIKHRFPHKPLVVTYYRGVHWQDFFSGLIKLYNYYYLPRLTKQADAVIATDVSPQQVADLYEELLNT